MSENINITHGRFKIVSLAEGHGPTSINYTLPGVQHVSFGEPVDVWTIRKDGDAFHLSIGEYPFTGVEDHKVIVSIDRRHNARWIATRREHHKAYTIQLASNESEGWTVSHGTDNRPVVEVRPIRATHSIPPQFSSSQLFRFEPVHD